MNRRDEMRVLFFTNLPSPYRVEFFNELGKYCDLTVLYETGASKERNADWKKEFSHYTYKSIFLKSVVRFNDSAICVGVTKYLRKGAFDIIVITGNSSIPQIHAITYLKAHKIPYLFESDGGIPKSGKGAKEWLKRKITSGAELYLSSGKMNDRYFLMYGAEENRLRHYPFTSLYDRDILPRIPTPPEKTALRKRLGITEEKVILSVGRFSYLGGYGKGYDVLLRAAKKLDRGIGIYIIGDEPTAEFVQMKQENRLDAVHFVGFMGKEALQEYYRAADLFVLMTVSDVWGLVINEAMSKGLPIITTDMCGAAPDLVLPGENGYILKVGDHEALAQRAGEILESESVCRNMAEKSLEIIRGYTYEKMVETHRKIFAEYMEHGNHARREHGNQDQRG